MNCSMTGHLSTGDCVIEMTAWAGWIVQEQIFMNISQIYIYICDTDGYTMVSNISLRSSSDVYFRLGKKRNINFKTSDYPFISLLTVL